MHPGQQPPPGHQPQWSGPPGRPGQHPFPTQPGQGGPPAYFADPRYGPPAAPPPRKNTGLVVGLIAAVVVLIAGATTGVILLLNNNDSGPGSSAREAAETFINAYNDHDAERVNSVVCAGDRLNEEAVRRLGDDWGTASLTSVGQGNPAPVEFEVVGGFAGTEPRSSQVLATGDADGNWTLCSESSLGGDGPGTTITG